MIFYVYELRFPEGKPFYVGKGSDSGERLFRRAHNHWRKHQLVKLVIAAMKDRGERPIVSIVFESDSEEAAFAEEKRLISEYGRRFNGGLLWNVCDGGRGGTPRGLPLSEAHRKKIGDANRGRKRTAEACERMRLAQLGKKRSAEHIAKVASARKGRVVSEETRRKISEAQKGKARRSHSPETKSLMSESAKVGWAKRRAKLSL